MSEVKLTLQQIREMHDAIEALPASGIKIEVLASIDLAMNKQKLKPYVDGFNDSTKPSPEMEKYNKEYNALLESDAQRNPNGSYPAINNKPIWKDREVSEPKLEELEKKYEIAIKEAEELKKKAEESLKTEHTIELNMIDRSSFSGTSQSAVAIMGSLIPIIQTKK